MKHRRRIEILVDLLIAAEKGTRKTRIMQEANLSHHLLQKYLREAVRNALVICCGSEFGLTEKGRLFLEEYQRLHEEDARVGSSMQELRSRMEALERTCWDFSGSRRKTRQTNF